jgi:hypothetical protein
VLRGKNLVALGNETLGKGGKVANDHRWIELLNGKSVGAIVINNGVAVVDEKRMGCQKIAPLNVHEGVVEKFIGVSRARKKRDLEDKRGTLGGALACKGSPCRNIVGGCGHNQMLRRRHLPVRVHILQAATSTRKHAPKG